MRQDASSLLEEKRGLPKKSSIWDEYGLKNPANERLIRQRFGAEFCMHAQLTNQESGTEKGIVCDEFPRELRKQE